MKLFIQLFLQIALVISVSGCGAIEGHKYLFTGQEGTPPPRTIEAAKSNFDDKNLVIGKSTKSQMESLLGSPSDVGKKQGARTYTYIKTIETKGISVDPGTIYIAKYTFGKNGKLSQINYSANPMRNPLIY